ncbi:unnamed protein product [Heligmosomoides polygyrus]|uniref:Zf-HC2 domain-containing protein n=1 Tax=Heligmosomoides polygyrus TaxID=6339 RepID=A0A183GUH1_HELPZ|nr:unnamed protein product [Heligmosomoides polygyrus]
MPHPPYSPDISPCDYHYYLSLKDFLIGRDTRTQAVLDNHVEQCAARHGCQGLLGPGVDQHQAQALLEGWDQEVG